MKGFFTKKYKYSIINKSEAWFVYICTSRGYSTGLETCALLVSSKYEVQSNLYANATHDKGTWNCGLYE